jgi:4-hydroxybenzoate polyprenyltransferase
MHPYLRLLRLHQPAGIWLLLWPCWWSIALASVSMPPLRLLALFGLGAVVMRGAGCIINDIADREFDKQVERTRARPLASGEVSLQEAFMLLAVLLCVALIIALQMNNHVLALAACSLVLVVTYPFMKRITWWPQAFLGLTFNWGALLGWAAVKGTLGLPALALYAGGIFWTLGYDTIYAHQDKKDDELVGIKSTALRLGAGSQKWIVGFYTVAITCYIIAGMLAHSGIVYLLGITCAAAHLFYQARYTDLNDPVQCMRTFRSNTMVGWILFIAMLGDSLFRFG